MARPNKQGLDYFPYDVDSDRDDRVAMIVGEFGHKGELIFIKLLAWIYEHNGYFALWKEGDQLKFATRVAYVNASVNLIREVVVKCVKWGLFDRDLFRTFGVLTSVRIQKTWLEATRKRTGVKINSAIWLIGEKRRAEPE